MRYCFGFISNSSSSSFLVKYRDFDYTNTRLEVHRFHLAKEQVKKLKKLGFCYTKYGLQSEYKEGVTLKEFAKYDKINLFLYITCNQDDVIYFLLKNNIAFIASCHYDQEIVCYDGKSDWFYQILNPYFIVESLLESESFILKEHLDLKTQEINVKEWLKKEEKYIEGLASKK